jgi:branched-subunit amino acid aminotransferase/4-amino-4-deoxychorismate lyase
VKDAKIMTPPREANILAGITRELLIKNFSKSFEIAEEPCHIDLLAEANVVFLTSSTKGIMPINEIEGNNYIFSKDHPIFMDLKNQFDKFLETAF